MYALFLRNDDNGGGLSVSRLVTPLADDHARPRFFAQDGAENGVKRAAEARRVSRDRRTGGLAAQIQTYLTFFPLLHMLGHVAEEGKNIQRLAVERDEPRVKLRDVTELADQGDDPGARLFRLVDHLALTVGERFAVTLQHSQIPADDARRRAEFVDCQRKQLGVSRLVRRRHENSHAKLS